MREYEVPYIIQWVPLLEKKEREYMGILSDKNQEIGIYFLTENGQLSYLQTIVLFR